MELLRFRLLGFFFSGLGSLELEASFTNNWGVLGLKVPDLPSDFSSNGDPVASGVESKAVN